MSQFLNSVTARDFGFYGLFFSLVFQFLQYMGAVLAVLGTCKSSGCKANSLFPFLVLLLIGAIVEMLNCQLTRIKDSLCILLDKRKL